MRVQTLLREAVEGERLMVVIPSSRVSSEEFLEALRYSGVDSRALGVGTARVVDQEGKRYRVYGAFIGAVSREASVMAEKIAKLCGITVAILD